MLQIGRFFKKPYIIYTALFFVSAISGVIINAGDVMALTTQSASGFQFSFNSSLSITLSSSDLVIPHLMPGNYASSNTISVDVSTNNSQGYTLTAKVGDKSIQKFANNSLVNAESSEATFASLLTSDKLVISNFGNGKWGYTTASTLAEGTTYSGLLYDADTVLNATKNAIGMPQSSAYPGTNTTNFTIAAKAGETQASGEYTNVINFRGVANVSTDFGLLYMQDLSTLSYSERQALLNYMQEGAAYQLRDSRDDTIYNIAKLKDGNIWMLDNLALDPATLKSGVTLDGTNTNIASGTTYTLPSSTTTGFDGTSGYTTAAINTSYKNTQVDLAVGQSGTGKVGVYYNYCAATAGTYCKSGTHTDTDNAQYDICPRGWRMPTGGASGEYQALRNLYTSDGAYVSALKMPLSGLFRDGTMLIQGNNGYFLSSTFYYSIVMYSVSVNTANINPQDGNYRYDGISVRCVFGPTMQNVTTSELANMMPNEGDTVTLLDTRDGTKYTVGKLADEKYWMLDNLALGSDTAMTLTNADTNMTASSWTLPASTTGFDGSDRYTAAAINADSKTTTQPLAAGQSGTGKVGVYYNYCAATVGTYCYASGSGTGNASPDNDICPKKWRMPTGGDSSEYQALRNKYSSNGALVTALKTPLSGYYSYGVARGVGSDGNFFSSTLKSSDRMYILRVDTSDADPQRDSLRSIGISVRCLFK